MEYASLQREMQIDASPEVVYEVISTAKHLQQWWPDEAELEPVSGSAGLITFGDPATPQGKVVPITVVTAEPARRFSFRWAYETDADGGLLVTFELSPSGGGTLLRFTETGFREQGWAAAELAEQYRDHSRGWDHFLPRLDAYAALLITTT